MENDSIEHIELSGDIRWRLRGGGALHRTDGPALITTNGTKKWYIHGKKHRTDGPAIEWGDGSKEWFIEGMRHREDGPAVITMEIGTQTQTAYWLHGFYIEPEEFEYQMTLKESGLGSLI